MKRFLILLIFSSSILSQERDPKELLDLIQSKFNNIADYSADIEIIFDLNFLDTSNSKAKLHFKQPDKIKIESDEFLIIPKQTLKFTPTKILSHPYSAIFIKNEFIENNMVDVIKVMPLVDSSDILLSTLWVDPLDNVIRKIESVTKKMGTITIHLSYESEATPILPSYAKFFFNITYSEINMIFENSYKSESMEEKGNGKLSGSIIIKYSNYLLNQNLDDSLFEKDDFEF